MDSDFINFITFYIICCSFIWLLLLRMKEYDFPMQSQRANIFRFLRATDGLECTFLSLLLQPFKHIKTILISWIWPAACNLPPPCSSYKLASNVNVQFSEGDSARLEALRILLSHPFAPGSLCRNTPSTPQTTMGMTYLISKLLYRKLSLHHALKSWFNENLQFFFQLNNESC